MSVSVLRATVRRLAPVFTLSLAALLSACGGEQTEPSGPGAAGGRAGPPPPAVTVRAVQSRDIQIHADHAGRVQGSRVVEVRAQVGGILLERRHTEGQTVEAGAILYRIDPAPLRIAVQRAQADEANAQAGLNQAEREWKRIRSLAQQGAVSTRERDRAESEVELANARLAVARAGLAQARLELSYADVRSPLAGVTARDSVSEGGLIERGALLTVVTQLDPVQVVFSLPQKDPTARRLARGWGTAQPADTQPQEVQLVLPDGQLHSQSGLVDYAEAGIDPATGTMTLRATFPNPQRALLPGEFLRVRLPQATLTGVYAVPPQAVGESAGGPVVHVVDEDSQARARPVQLGSVFEGQQIILDGLQDGDRVIVNGQVAVRDGATVKVQPAPQETEGKAEGGAR